MRKILFFIVITFMNTAIAALPKGFVYLKDVDPTIIVHLSYITEENFIGKPLDGYKKNVAILTREAAEALSSVQKEVQKDGYSLVIYDAYRPQKTVDQFVVWSNDFKDQKMKPSYYPRVEKKDLFRLEYMGEKSSHTRGSTVDLSLIPLGEKIRPIKKEKRQLKDGFEVLYLDDGTVDMETSFDLFDEASHPGTSLVGEEALALRQYLQDTMEAHGFVIYPSEWWHFTLKNEPFPDTYFNFDIE